MPTRRCNDGSEYLRAEPVRSWFAREFPDGPTPAQRLAWPAIAAGENVLLVSPTGTGKTLAAFLAILDRLHAEERPSAGLRCVYVSPLRSLGYDVERNLIGPLDAIRLAMGRDDRRSRVSGCGRATRRPASAPVARGSSLRTSSSPRPRASR